MMRAENDKSLMRCLGEFVGHLANALKSDKKTCEMKRTIEERTSGNVTLRRTTIDEIEIEHEDSNSD